jgi:ribosome-binding protein aMBF1 (putative translation factor)
VAGIRWEAPVTADRATDREQLERVVKPRRDFFEKRIGMYCEEWLSATDRAIELRRTVSSAQTVNTNGEIEKQELDTASAPAKAEGVESKSTNAAPGNERESFVQPILDEKGWSIHQLAVEAEVDFHTVNDYLKGRTRPNRSTRKHLADALSIAVGRLPK